jgi:hypothetical protein
MTITTSSSSISHGGYPTFGSGQVNGTFSNTVASNGGVSGSITTTNSFSGIQGSFATGAKPLNDFLPNLTMTGYEMDGNPVSMTVSPEAGISSIEAVRLMMLMFVVTNAPGNVNPLAYVRKQGLERHFTYG